MYPDIEVEQYTYIFPAPVTIQTNGSGWWTSIIKEVECVSLLLDVTRHDDDCWGEVQVFFNPATWDVNHDGLIYTDEAFLKNFYWFLWTHFTFNSLILTEKHLSYSEQGMQGIDYVSLNCSKEFINEFLEKVNGERIW
jgi:hypothetical protein